MLQSPIPETADEAPQTLEPLQVVAWNLVVYDPARTITDDRAFAAPIVARNSMRVQFARWPSGASGAQITSATGCASDDAFGDALGEVSRPARAESRVAPRLVDAGGGWELENGAHLGCISPGKRETAAFPAAVHFHNHLPRNLLRRMTRAGFEPATYGLKERPSFIPRVLGTTSKFVPV